MTFDLIDLIFRTIAKHMVKVTSEAKIKPPLNKYLKYTSLNTSFHLQCISTSLGFLPSIMDIMPNIIAIVHKHMGTSCTVRIDKLFLAHIGNIIDIALSVAIAAMVKLLRAFDTVKMYFCMRHVLCQISMLSLNITLKTVNILAINCKQSEHGKLSINI